MLATIAVMGLATVLLVYEQSDIDETRYLAEVKPLKLELAALSMTSEAVDLERAASYLVNLGALFAKASLELRRRFLVEVMGEMGVEGQWVRHIKPRPQYAALFALDRGRTLRRRQMLLAPWADSEETQVNLHAAAILCLAFWA